MLNTAMLNSLTYKLKWLALRIAAFVAVLIFISVGPYQFYHREDPSLFDFSQEAPPSSHHLPDFAAIENTGLKKAAFFDFLRPKVEQENQRILKERAFLISIDVTQISSTQIEKAQVLAESYLLPLKEDTVSSEWLNEMLKRVNVLPEALVLTQAANESAWGTSRFAVEANNLFGHWCYTKGCGIVPKQRGAGKTHEVEKFPSVDDAVNRYFMNVNRNKAYAPLRDVRFLLDAQEQDLLSTESALALAEGLSAYSERGEDYVNDLRSMIHHNQTYWKK
ncbi:glucosaminidase [Vibrio azureus]|uniref:Bax protein n=1 Tax=Vibrio azureus NBRC 104587 TaxID=1219077 RepID=U3A3N3_9VIBR|nr:glucosaminidase domain-containing protein [Vibrio azureus]AUI86116.1 glucosaminidase [Vibrio azureus]GAD74621.1 Bax protein [Vibrio azureus NBRC 104587]